MKVINLLHTLCFSEVNTTISNMRHVFRDVLHRLPTLNGTQDVGVWVPTTFTYGIPLPTNIERACIPVQIGWTELDWVLRIRSPSNYEKSMSFLSNTSTLLDFSPSVSVKVCTLYHYSWCPGNKRWILVFISSRRRAMSLYRTWHSTS